ncbi:MAG: molybdenum cofactor guanylyltransferase MobA [Mesorhizobium sp.]|nr:molybdenum cofactor guanylyltransferase MobA [Mesorhizobium sp.]
MIAGVILAGGRSSRLGGGDKSLLTIAGEPMLGRVIDRFAPQVASLAINANGDAMRFAAFRLPVLADTITGYAGPLAGILAGLDWAATLAGVTHLATVAGDTPFLPRDLVERLAAGRSARIVIAASGGREHPVVGLWPLATRLPLAEFLADNATRRVTAFTQAMGAGHVEFDLLQGPSGAVDPFYNVNTPDDLATARTLAKEMAP